jgi:hypothetical protein
MNNTQIVKDALDKFPQLPNRTVARYILHNYGIFFDGNLEKIRSSIRYQVGKMGSKHRGTVGEEVIRRGPIKMPMTWRQTRTSYRLPPGLWLVLGDVHIPFHEPKPIESAFKYAQDHKVDGILLNGDAQDCAAISFWPSTVRRDFDKEIEAFIDFLDFLEQEFPNVKKVYKPGNHECFDEQTECLTRNGWLLHGDIKEDTEIASLNNVTREIEYSVPSLIHRFEFDGKMRKIVGSRTDLLVTENHRILYKPGGSGIRSQWRTEEMSSIPTGNNRVVLPVSGTTNRIGISLSDDEIAISGWILTDGSIRNRTEGSYRYSFSQRASKVHKITTILDGLNWRYSSRQRERTTSVIVGKRLKSKPEPEVTIQVLGAEANKKAYELVPRRGEIPSWAWKLSSAQFRVFLSAIVDGDGSRHKTSPDTTWMVYNQKHLLDELQSIAIEHGWRSSLTEYRPTHWRLNINPGTTTALDCFGTHVSEEQYHGIVWCVTTNNDTIVVRRNGKISITGNSRLPRYYASKAPELIGLPVLAMDTVLGLEYRGIEFLQYKQIVMAGKLPILHGDELRISTAVNPARGLFLKAKSWAMCSHFHSTSEHTARDINGKILTTWSTGCLCDLSPDYQPYGEWNFGFALVNVEKNGDFTVENRRILPSGTIA